MAIPDDFLPDEWQHVREAAHDVVEAAGTYDAEDVVLIAAGEIIADLREQLWRLRKAKPGIVGE